MALGKRRCDSIAPVNIPIPEEIQAPRESTLTVLNDQDGRYDRLLKYIEGKPWTVRYYGQMLNTHSVVNHFDTEEGNLSQSYVKINDIIFKVQSELSFSYENEEGEGILTGSAIVPFKLVPNVGDVFVGNVDTGEDVLFVVNAINRLSHRKDSVYEVEYSSSFYLNDDPDAYKILENRVQEELFYDNYMDSRNRNVLFSAKEKDQVDYLRNFLSDSQSYFYNTFIQPHTVSFGVPGTLGVAFDPLMNSFIKETTNSSDMNVVNSHDYSIYSLDYRRDTILDYILRRALPHPRRVEKQVGFYTLNSFFKRSQFMTLHYMGIKYVSHPVSAFRGMFSTKVKVQNTGSPVDLRNSENYDLDLSIYIDAVSREGNSAKAVLNSLFVDNYYIVSESFYEYIKDGSNYENISFFELMLARFLKKETLSYEDLVKLLSRWEEWSLMHQYYLLPIVWLMVKVTVGVV